MGGSTGHDAAFADMIQGLKNDAINRGATSLMDEDVGTLGVPDPRILICLLYTSPSPRDNRTSRMPSSA